MNSHLYGYSQGIYAWWLVVVPSPGDLGVLGGLIAPFTTTQVPPKKGPFFLPLTHKKHKGTRSPSRSPLLLKSLVRCPGPVFLGSRVMAGLPSHLERISARRFSSKRRVPCDRYPPSTPAKEHLFKLKPKRGSEFVFVQEFLPFTVQR